VENPPLESGGTGPSHPLSAPAADSGPALLATGIVYVTAALFNGALPGIVTALTDLGRLDAAQAGYVVAADLLAQVAGSLLYVGQGRRLRWSTSVSIGLVVLVAGNVLSCFAPSALAMIMTRLVSGAGAGVLRSACSALFGHAANPARAIALLGAAQVTGMSAAFAVFPWLTRAIGWYGPYLLLSALGLLMFATAPWWPRKFTADHLASISLSFTRAGVLCLAGVFLYFLAQTGVWAFVGAIGAARGTPSDTVSSALAYIAVPGLAASAVASAASARISVRSALIIGLSLTLAGLSLLTISGGVWTFAMGVALFYFAWCATVPFQFASAAACDRHGNTAATFLAADGLGMAAGPAIAGTMVVRQGTLALVVLAALCTALSIALFLMSDATRARKSSSHR
jgi:MFS transporter, DHA1 family, inner membrane transport protein